MEFCGGDAGPACQLRCVETPGTNFSGKRKGINRMKRHFQLGLIALAFFTGAPRMRAQLAEFSIDDRTVTVHGFFTQGFMLSNGNNFITADTSQGTFQMTDGALNIGTNLTDKLHIGAQVYDRYIGQLGKGEVTLDWAYADYRMKDWLGFRGGKVKTALGLYNDTQDMDFLHTWALLPQSIYPTDLRSVNIAEIGGTAYGEIPVWKAGSLSYQVYGGQRPFDWRSGDLYGLADEGLPATKLPTGTKIGEDIRWRTPLKGLMVGMSHESLNEHIVGTILAYHLPAIGNSNYDNVWDGYTEYSWKRLKLASEYQTESRAYTITAGGRPVPNRAANLESFFASATWRFTSWFQVGTYNSRFQFDANAVPGVLPGASAFIHDQTVTMRFDYKRHYTFKIEGHFMDGVGSPISAHGFYLFDNPQGLKPKTDMLVATLGFNI